MRLDHLLSKEHLQSPCLTFRGCGGVVRSTPVAQTLVLRRVLTGGISANSGRRVFPAPSTDFRPLGWWSWNGGGECLGGLVFGTLLGPETTGPWHGRCSPFRGGCGLWCGAGLFLVSWLHRARTHGVCGVCGTGLLFENYIVDASIFYKKQFPRI